MLIPDARVTKCCFNNYFIDQKSKRKRGKDT